MWGPCRFPCGRWVTARRRTASDGAQPRLHRPRQQIRAAAGEGQDVGAADDLGPRVGAANQPVRLEGEGDADLVREAAEVHGGPAGLDLQDRLAPVVIFGALGQFERDLIRERTRAGLVAAVARGRKGGRTPVVTEDKLRRAKALLVQGLTVREAAARIKVGKTALYAALGVKGDGDVDS
ncbi:recombinase family protein [Azospirillum agricola]